MCTSLYMKLLCACSLVLTDGSPSVKPSAAEYARAGEKAWRSAVSNLRHKDAQASRTLYNKAWLATNETAFEYYWEYVRLSSVAAILDDSYPNDVGAVLLRELQQDSKTSASSAHGPTNAEHTQIPQLAALLHLNTTLFKRTAAAWASAFWQEGALAAAARRCPSLHPTATPALVGVGPGAATSARLHLAYLSAHFRDHPAGHHLPGLVRLADRSRFHITCIATSAEDGSIHRNRARHACTGGGSAAATWVEVPASDPQALARALLRATPPIDILVYIDGYDRGHSAGGLALAHHCAQEAGMRMPLVVSFFGFLGTLGSISPMDSSELGVLQEQSSTGGRGGDSNRRRRAIADAVLTDAHATPWEQGREMECAGAPAVIHHALGTGPACSVTGAEHDAIGEQYILRHPHTFFFTDYSTAHPEVWPKVADIEVEAGGHLSSPARPLHSINADLSATYTFCSFNQLFRVTPSVLQAWAHILLRTAQPTLHTCSVDGLCTPVKADGASSGSSSEVWLPTLGPTLVLMGHPPIGPPGIQAGLRHLAPRLLDLWEEILANRSTGHFAGEAVWSPESVAALASSLVERVAFRPIEDYSQHLLWKRDHCSLGLDTPMYNGHTSVSDLLWAGVPVLTFAVPGATMAGRAASSLLHAADAPDQYVTTDIGEYVDRAVAHYNCAHLRSCVGDEARWAAWRPTASAPLFDSQQWVRAYEDLLVQALRGTGGAEGEMSTQLPLK